jgi:hypothetical protein
MNATQKALIGHTKHQVEKVLVFGTGNNQFNQNPNFGPPNSNSMYNERNSKGFDRTYQALSGEGPGFGTGNNQFNQNPNFGPPNSNSMYATQKALIGHTKH